MNLNRSTLSRLRGLAALLCVGGVASLACNAAHGAFATHLYDLNNTLADSLGGPSMVSAGGTLGPTGYTYGNHQGPNVSNAIDPNTYSIEMKFTINTGGNFQHMLNFKDLTTDSGLYEQGEARVLVSSGPLGSPSFNVAITNPAHLVVTRDGVTNRFRVYVNGVSTLNFIDNVNVTNFTGPNNIAHFLIDNTPGVPGGENPTGFLDFVHIYNGVLSPTQAADLNSGTLTPLEVPEPASFTLICLGAAVLFKRRR